MKISAKFMCPYCGNENKTIVDVDTYPQHEVVYCDGSEGGCEKLAVITHKAFVNVTARKIVGE